MGKDLHYLDPVLEELTKQWPYNRTVNIVCHGHSVPSGYFAPPLVDSFHAYPHLLHRLIKERFPFAVVNVIVTGIGGETSELGEKRFERDVLTHKPDVVTIDYALNDRMIGVEKAEASLRSMIAKALEQNIKVILLTPIYDQSYFAQDDMWKGLEEQAAMIRRLSEETGVGLADSFLAFEKYIAQGSSLTDLLSHYNHPSHAGHTLIAKELGYYFCAR